MKGFGRACQFAALVILPVAMLFQLGGGNGEFFGVNHLVYALVFGVILFCVGRLVEGYAAQA
ncbi:MAG: hypothetical protein NXI22_01125 [bacterium]|nr:hypothetical protein [bacterium]